MATHVSVNGAESKTHRKSKLLAGTPLFEVQGTPFIAHPSALAGLALIYAGLLAVVRSKYRRVPGFFKWIIAGVWLAIFEASYIVHTIGHVVSAQEVNAPVDGVVVLYGLMPTLYKNNHVTPHQHVGRAMGGPIITVALMGVTYFLWRVLRWVPLIGGILEAILLLNGIGLAFALAPTLQFDGGTLIKWSVTAQTGEEALGEEAVRQIGFAAAGIAWLIAFILLLRGKFTLALGCIIWGVYICIDQLFIHK